MVSKNQKEIADKFEKNNSYSLDDAVRMVKELTYAKFDESVDLAVKLKVDPRHAEENIRITTPLPNGTGKELSILVLTSGPKEKEALDAGADYFGNKEYLENIGYEILLPCKKILKLVSKKPISPTRKEINDNKRSRSAKLRIVERLSAWKKDRNG